MQVFLLYGVMIVYRLFAIVSDLKTDIPIRIHNSILSSLKTTKTMSNPNFPYLPPADWHDFAVGSVNDVKLVNQLNVNLQGFTAQNVIGNPWIADNAFPATVAYFSPGTADDPGNDPKNVPGAAVIEWEVFPGRLSQYFPTMPAADQYSICDTGYDTKGDPIPPITTNPCTQQSEDLPYGPYGPRGWQDEYCEWCVVYDVPSGGTPEPGTSQITRVDFTCENPEYINSVWLVDPNQVVEIYRSALNQPGIQLSDLYLSDSKGNPVLDPVTGQNVYNPLNKWNCGPQCTYDSNGNVVSGGAMHLTSTPNTIQTEIAISAYATVPRTSGNQNNNQLICCGQFGQIYRNSDPNIGAGLNSAVNGALNAGDVPTSVTLVTLANPPGLYMQFPDYTQYSWAKTNTPFTPADMNQFFTVKRGYLSSDANFPAPLANINNILNAKGEGPYDFILHLTFSVPAGKSISDILINGNPVTWAGQIAQTIKNHVIAMAYAGTTPQTVSACVGSAGQCADQPVQLFHESVFNALSNTTIPAPSYTSADNKPNLLYNSTYIAPFARPGNTYPMVLSAALHNSILDEAMISVTFSKNGVVCTDITATLTSVNDNYQYCVPGNSYPSTYQLLYLNVQVGEGCATGIYDVSIRGCAPMPALLNVIASS